jgi:hypothetical protein
MKWIHFWQDCGSFTCDEMLTDPRREKILDDDRIWDVYVRAQEVLEQARQGIIDSLRDPTDEEIAARKADQIELVKAEGLNPDDYF